ncbi:hypothetical protein [Corticibacter populi]|uniref:hypothetical protein n=1 Tax=Corticibacter populi TaxID=1550736 RepID=UPI00102CCB88|nr:hypothetical protein [Corticibacter populi]
MHAWDASVRKLAALENFDFWTLGLGKSKRLPLRRMASPQAALHTAHTSENLFTIVSRTTLPRRAMRYKDSVFPMSGINIHKALPAGFCRIL